MFVGCVWQKPISGKVWTDKPGQAYRCILISIERVISSLAWLNKFGVCIDSESIHFWSVVQYMKYICFECLKTLPHSSSLFLSVSSFLQECRVTVTGVLSNVNPRLMAEKLDIMTLSEKEEEEDISD